MKETIKKAFLGRIIFSGTSLLFFLGFAAYTSLPTQNTGDTITQSIWNNLINKVNEVGTNLDTLSGSQLGVGQTWQDMKSSRLLRTTYTNNTGRPIYVSINVKSSVRANFALYVNGYELDSTTEVNANEVENIGGIIPNGATYILGCGAGNTTTFNTWMELR
ncbi:MAG: hypothetical protein PHR68_01080 [Candidatus Gracilibacteria bacterium]|nr:hypothetical protein [Candidatus Gracilibacteria bacterium]